ncbi:MAG: auracyanin family protein [Flammeovirgaceae bacterium]|nr:auracyanin family protein [Flammeovirgaceae bacterium]
MNISTTILFTLIISFISYNCAISQPNESDYYQINQIYIPKEISLEVGGLAFNDKGSLGVSTRRGEVWLILNPENTKSEYIRFAHGLHEPLGLLYHEGSFFCNQRGELTQLIDEDGDNQADIYKTITKWNLNGNYHEYSYGPILLPDGQMLVTLNLGWIGYGDSGSKWRGWMLKVSQDGKVTPYATGLRSPAGFGVNAEGDIFYTENQGDWVGSGRMTHLESGDFAGNPAGLRWSAEMGSPVKLKFGDIDDTKNLSLYENQNELEGVKAPSIWFPHTLMGISTSDINFFSKKMGPFEGQMMVGDQGHSKIMRVFQEKINGVYQGVCFPFIEGFASGVLRIINNPNNDAFYVGQTNRGWGSTGQSSYALERVSWTGKIPFEIKTIKVHPEGFLLEFTQPVEKSVAKIISSYEITDFTYLYHHFYGSDVQNKESRNITDISVSEDGLNVLLKIDQFRKGYIYEIKATGILNKSGQPLLHDFGYYTLNEIPERKSNFTAKNTATSITKKVSVKHITVEPETWLNQIDVNIEIGTAPGLKFDQSSITVVAGSKVKLTFNNNDDMPHNFLLIAQNKEDEVGIAATKLGLNGAALDYVPETEAVIAHTNLLAPHEIESIYFTAPDVPGPYPFLCTFPGHYLTMRGVLTVTPKSVL